MLKSGLSFLLGKSFEQDVYNQISRHLVYYIVASTVYPALDIILMSFGMFSNVIYPEHEI